MGNTKDFGDTTENVYSNVGGGNGLRGIFAGGFSGNNSPDTDLNIIDYFTFREIWYEENIATRVIHL